MKSRKFILVAFLFGLFLLNTEAHSQSASKESLEKSMVESILKKDVEAFKALLLPKEVVLTSYENDIPEETSREERETLMQQSEAAYDNVIIPQYESNFWEIVKLSETYNIDWSDRNLTILYKYASNDPEHIPYFIHVNLKNAVYRHFYFSAVRHKGSWYFEDKMELTKNEKYSARD